MNGLSTAPLKSVFVSSLLVASTALTGGLPVFAATNQAIVVDGAPTETACSQLGFAPPGEREDDGGGGAFRRALGVVTPTAKVAPGIGTIAPAPLAAGPATMSDEAFVDTELYPDATPNPIKRVAEQPVSTFSIDVDTASYSNVRRFLNDGALPPRDAVRVEELINYFDYGYGVPQSPDTPFNITATLAPSPWAPGREIVHIGLQGYDIARVDQPPLNLVFLVDVSGSMDGPDRLGLAQKALNVLIDQLRPEDRVALAVYAGAAGAVLASDTRQREAEAPLCGERPPCGRVDRGRRGARARLWHGRAGVREERGQPRHSPHRR